MQPTAEHPIDISLELIAAIPLPNDWTLFQNLSDDKSPWDERTCRRLIAALSDNPLLNEVFKYQHGRWYLSPSRANAYITLKPSDPLRTCKEDS